MKTLSFILFLSLALSCAQTALAQRYHFQEEFTKADGNGSDSFLDWTTNNEKIDGKTHGGVNAYGGGMDGDCARFRADVATLISNDKFAYAGELTFIIMEEDEPADGDMDPTFSVSTSTDGTTWTTLYTITRSDLVVETAAASDDYVSKSVSINSTEAVYIKIETVAVYTASWYAFSIDNLYLTDITPVADDNVELTSITASCKTVSSEEITFALNADGNYEAHDSISYDQAPFTISAIAKGDGAVVEVLQQANPAVGETDTTIFRVTAADGTTTETYNVLISRSGYMCKFGVLSVITQNTDSYDGWTFAGNRYPSASKGGGGLYPGEKAMRIYSASGKMTSPMFSQVGTLSFAAKFSFTADESLLIQTSTDGSNFTTIETFTPADGRIPSYTNTEEVATDVLAYVRVEVDQENVYVRFAHDGAEGDPRIMIDDIAITPHLLGTTIPSFSVKVYDEMHQPISGASVTVGESAAVLSDADGVAVLSDVAYGLNVPYSVSKDSYTNDGLATISSVDTEMEVSLVLEPMDVYLALGQSNMAGRAPMTDYVMADLAQVSLLDDNNVWQVGKNPMNLYSNVRKDVEDQQVGPSYAFSKTVSQYIGKRVGMIVNARGGTNVSQFTTGEYSTQLIDRVAESKMYNIKSIIWHQGEGDRSSSSSYMGKLNTLVTNLRTEIGEDVLFVAGQLGPWDLEGEPKYGAINDTISHIANYIANSDYVSSLDMKHKGDATHFNLEAQMLLGQRYAQNILAHNYNIDISIVDVELDAASYIVYGDDTITVDNMFSITSLSGADTSLVIYPTDGGQFSSLELNGQEVSSAVGQSSFTFPFSITNDTALVIVAETTSTSLKSNLDEVISLFPNPATEQLSLVNLTEWSTASIDYSIYSLDGKCLSASQTTGGVDVLTIDISGLNNGVYFIRLSDESGKTAFEKFVKK